jgi:hypothetical protein
MSIQTVGQATFDFFADRPVVVEVSHAPLTSDAGLLPFRELDQHLGFTQQFAAALNDPRDSELINHSMLDMVRARVYGVLADYEDQNDHDILRHDPLFKILVDRLPDGPALASQPTLSRFENVIDIPSLKRLRDVFIDQFIASFERPPLSLTLDLDAVDDPSHGAQQLTLFHGFFAQYQYFPAFITCAENDLFVMASLRHGSAHAALGCDDDLRYLVQRLRQVWPDIRIHVRGDAAYGVPWMYEVCRELEITYTFGLAANRTLQAWTDELLAQAVTSFEQAHPPVVDANCTLEAWTEALLTRAVTAFQQTGVPVKLFDVFAYKAGTWPVQRTVVVKVEANALGTNRRFVVTNRLGAWHYPQACYEAYAERGESENRNKEFKVDMAMGRTSDHRFLANYFRLYLYACALNLLVRMRHVVADPPPLELIASPLLSQSAPVAAASLGATAAEPLSSTWDLSAPSPEPLPLEAQPAATKKRYHQHRRQRDPLGQGQPCTWRSLVIKVAAEVTVSARRIVVRLSSSWPHLNYFQLVCRRLSKHIHPATATG